MYRLPCGREFQLTRSQFDCLRPLINRQIFPEALQAHFTSTGVCGECRLRCVASRALASLSGDKVQVASPPFSCSKHFSLPFFTLARGNA